MSDLRGAVYGAFADNKRFALEVDSIIASHFNNNDPTSFVDR
jgi:hypothetical protein